jgi:cathepsin B
LKCLSNCTNPSYNVPYTTDKKFGNTSYSIAKDVAQIQMEIFKNGPIVAVYAVYEDFLHYKTGVYVQTTGMYIGGHAVKVIGWGNENGLDYWLVVNSWNTDWGNNGFFKILRGVDHLGIESQIR